MANQYLMTRIILDFFNSQYYAKLGCASTGGLRLSSYSDASCTHEINTNLGLYNDIKVSLYKLSDSWIKSALPHMTFESCFINSYFHQVSFNTCQSCLAWPANNDDANADLDDQFDFYHQYDSKFCSAAQHYKQKCGWGCKRKFKKASSGNTASSMAMKHSWNGFEKFFLFFWSCCGESGTFY